MLFFAIVLTFIVIICLSVFTIGLIYFADNNPIPKLFEFIQTIGDSSEKFLNFTKICFNMTKWIALAGIIFSIASIVFTVLTKRSSKVPKIVLFSLLIVIFVVIFAFQLITGGLQ